MESCERCQKSPELCVCDAIRELATHMHVLILQHPQEPDKHLGSARLAHLSLPNSSLKIGLSWPNLKAALGREAQPSKWAVLYLGSGVKGKPPEPGQLKLVTKNGEPLLDAQKIQRELEGLVVLDGTWSQAKAIWWRNAWLLKLRRAILNPARPSQYRELRREPRGECLSTIESVGAALTALGEPAEVETQLREVFAKLLDRYRASTLGKSAAARASKPLDRRRRRR